MPYEYAPAPFDPIRHRIRARLVEQSVASLAVAVARDGEILWEQGFGWADRENRMPATEHTLYSLASISKPITATGLMVLKERGRLELDRPVNDCLGEAKLTARAGDAAGATVRRVANHTSGLPLHWQFFCEDEPYLPPPMEETIRRYGNLVTPPGEKYQYSNLGYGVLDHVISRLSGASYAGFMRAEVFVPLGMTRASVGIGPGLEPSAAARYSATGWRIPFYDFDHRGGSAIYCSAHDLVRFGLFHLKAHLPDQKAILSDETLDEMHAATADTGGASGYGVGWAINEDDRGYRTVAHGGGMGGVSTLLTLVPAERIAVAVLTNSNPASGASLPGLITQEIVAALLPLYAQKRAEEEAQRPAESKPAGEPAPAFAPPPELLGEWRGAVHTWAGEIPLTLLFQPDSDIHTRLGSQLRTLVDEVRLNNGTLTGKMIGDLGTDDTRRRPYHLALELKQRGEALNGTVHAISSDSAGRPGFALGHWLEVTKTA